MIADASAVPTLAPYFQRRRATLYQGDVLDVLRQMPSESVHCAVTSPPYWGLRDYGTATWKGGPATCDHLAPAGGIRNNGRDRAASGGTFHDSPKVKPAMPVSFRDTCGKCGARRIDQQIGLEATPAAYVERMVEVFGELRRVLRSDGTLWLNLGDSYGHGTNAARRKSQTSEKISDAQHEAQGERHGGAAKQLLGIPWRVALALQTDGWWLRSDIIWSKPNPMPESVTDRPTKSYEHVFLLAKSATYYYDQEAVREPSITADMAEWPGSWKRAQIASPTETRTNGFRGETQPANGRNLRDVWTIATQPYSEAHFATFPEALVEPCIKAGTSEHGVCPVCGAPWRRVVERTETPSSREARGKALTSPRHDGSTWNENGGRGFMPVVGKDAGWQPTCAHGTEPVPAVCLDPFAGSGTVLLVAQRLGRCGVGIELNREYAEIAARRLSQEVLAW